MSVLNRKLLRDLWQSKGQVVAVMAVIACGVAVYVTFYACYHNLLLTRDSYYARYRFHDMAIQLEKAPQSAVFRIAALPGVREASGRIVKDVNLSVAGDDENKIARLISLPARNADVPGAQINGIYVVQGRLFSPDVPDEVLVESRFFKANGLSLGDRLAVTVNGRRQSLKIVGTALSPEYVYNIRNIQEMLPNPKKFAIVWVQQLWAESQLDLKGSVNDIVAEIEDPEQAEKLLDQAGDLLKPYGVYAKVPRKQQISHWFLKSDLDGLQVSAKITPTIFLSIAAIILLILLSRMVQRERTQIGLLKAYGYRDLEIALHYVKFAGLVGLLGGLVGYGLGQWMARGMIQMYIQFYSFPLLSERFYPGLLASSLAISTGTALASALLVVRSVVYITPASAMRDNPPVSAHRTPLERIQSLWRQLSFTNKIIVRNVFRYPLRSGFTVLGVMFATAILLMGYFTRDAMDYMMLHQFSKVQREDMRVSFYLERGFDALYTLQRLPEVLRVEPQLLYAFELRQGWKKKELLITGLADDQRLFGLLDQHEQQIRIEGDGLVLMSQTAKELGLEIGDLVSLKPLIGRVDREVVVRIDQIMTQYIGSGAYMRLEALSRLLREPRAMNAVLLKLEPGSLKAINRRLKDIPAVASVEVKQDAFNNFQKTMGESMGISNFFMLLFAGVIAVAVIYNSTAISITERRREMASLRVLGYSTGEVGRIVFNENLLLSLLGLAIGLPFGTWMCMGMTQAYSTDVYRFPYYLSNTSYFITTGVILVFVFLSNWLSRRKIVSIDMVEALKSRE
ncbi:MAG: FtsX-like permease family protein [Candidatus Sericytochromatia bacterium]